LALSGKRGPKTPPPRRADPSEDTEAPGRDAYGDPYRRGDAPAVPSGRVDGSSAPPVRAGRDSLRDAANAARGAADLMRGSVSARGGGLGRRGAAAVPAQPAGSGSPKASTDDVPTDDDAPATRDAEQPFAGLADQVRAAGSSGGVPAARTPVEPTAKPPAAETA
jgi:hypothetical protein